MKRITPLLALMAAVLCGCDRTQTRNAAPSTAAPLPMTNMVLINAGIFHRDKQALTIPQFWIGRFEVTQGEYSAFTGKNPSHFTNGPACPVEKVTFNDAVSFCARLTERERNAGRLPTGFEYRLPWEIEWEYACLAGSTNRFSFGQSPEEADPHAWTAENSDAAPHPVGLKRPNAWGLHDMHGNVWEWCLDSFKPEPGKPAPPNAGKFKIFKGGGWNQDAEFAGAANRFMMSPSYGIHFVGFRIVLAETR
jgi:formylglycine-generating enzyme required for sulfatase activity